MIKRILVGVCDPQYTAAISLYARDLAERHRSTFTAIAVTDMHRLRDVGPVAVGAGSFAKDLVDDRIEHNDAAIEESLRMIVERLDEVKVRCEIIKASGDPYAALADASRYHDLMIFGLRGLLDHGVTDEPPHELVRLIKSGVHPILATGPKFHEVRRVLIAYSGSVESARTTRSFANLGLWPEAKTKIVHFGEQREDGAVLLADLASYLQQHGLDAEVEMVEGSPRTLLLQHALNWKADLIVVGNSAQSLLLRRVFGETALHLIRESQVPLFLSQ